MGFIYIIFHHKHFGFSSGNQTWFQWEFQGPKMEVLYHIRPYFVGIFPYIGLRILKWLLNYWMPI